MKILEKDIQREICDWLNKTGFYFWRNNNTPIFDRGKGSFRAMPKYARRGLPDIMIIRGGRLIGLEVKVPDYWKYTDDQVQVKDDFLINGAYYSVVTSLDDVKGYLSKIL